MKTKRVSKEYLKNQYLIEGKSIRKIAAEQNVVMATVQRWLVYYEIPRRPQNEYPRTEEWRQKMSDAKRKSGRWSKEDNPNWKGGIAGVKNERNNGRMTWWRKSVKRRDNYICQKCGIDGKIPCGSCHRKPVLHADHIKPWSDYPELRYEISNGRTLCEDCHLRSTG